MQPDDSDTGRKEISGDPQIQDRIAQRAYELYEQRGGEPGGDVDDWLAAEREILGSAEAMGATAGTGAAGAERAAEGSAAPPRGRGKGQS